MYFYTNHHKQNAGDIENQTINDSYNNKHLLTVVIIVCNIETDKLVLPLVDFTIYLFMYFVKTDCIY